MAGNHSRNKGARGERELFGLLTAELGFIVERNLSQTRGGGADCITIPGWSIEVKRCETLAIPSWWRQAVEQALEENKKPILFYRKSRAQWAAVVEGKNISGGIKVSFEYACKLIRESL